MTGQEVLPLPVVHPATGEVLDAAGAAGDQLAEWHDQLAAIKRAADTALRDVDTELRHRMGDRTGPVPMGTWEVSAKTPRTSVWDWEELEVVLRELVEAGVVQAGDVTEVIYHKTGGRAKEAGDLVKRLAGVAKDNVERCRSYKPGTTVLVVEQSVALPAPEETP